MSNTSTKTTQDSTIPKEEDISSAQQTYQFVALSATIAIQDAADNLRSINTICTTALGSALAQAIENPASAEQIQKVIAIIQGISQDAAVNFELISNKAAIVVKNFPKSSN